MSTKGNAVTKGTTKKKRRKRSHKKAAYIQGQLKKGRSPKQAEADWKRGQSMRAMARHRKRRKKWEQIQRRQKRQSEPERRKLGAQRARMTRTERASVVPADLGRIEQALARHFELAKQRPFKEIVWCRGPSDLPTGQRLAIKYAATLRSVSRSRSTWRRRRRNDPPLVDLQAWGITIGPILPPIRQLLSAPSLRGRHRMRRMRWGFRSREGFVPPPRMLIIGEWVSDTRLRQAMDVLPLSAYMPFIATSMARCSSRREFGALADAAEAGLFGYWLSTDRTIFALPRPIIHVDERGRVHAEDGPAVIWADGCAAYALHGVAVPPELVTDPDWLTVEVIDATPNAELRRLFIEQFGADRYLREGHAILLDEAEEGKLWGKPQWDDDPFVMVEVVNATPEPDGSCKTYFLRVPPDMRSAKEAVAWTFEQSSEGYAPRQQT